MKYYRINIQTNIQSNCRPSEALVSDIEAKSLADAFKRASKLAVLSNDSIDEITVKVTEVKL